MDSNAEPGALAHKAFLEGGLIDGWTGGQDGGNTIRPPTFHNYEGPTFQAPAAVRISPPPRPTVRPVMLTAWPFGPSSGPRRRGDRP